MTNAPFLSLARRLGNPIAELPDAVGALALLSLTRACQTSGRRKRLLQAALARLPWFSRSTPVALMTE